MVVFIPTNDIPSTPESHPIPAGRQVITSEVESHVEDGYTVIPGVGNFGDRYFCE